MALIDDLRALRPGLADVFESMISTILERAQQHGNDNHFARIAELAKVHPNTVYDVLLAVKVARAETSPNNDDNLLDFAGYAMLAMAEMRENQPRGLWARMFWKNVKG